MNSSRSMNATQANLRGVIGAEILVGRDLARAARPIDHCCISGEARSADQIGAPVHAAVVVEHETIDTDHVVERQPLQDIGRLVFENRTDGDLVHISPRRAGTFQVLRSARSRGANRIARVSSISASLATSANTRSGYGSSESPLPRQRLNCPVFLRLRKVMVNYHHVVALGGLDRVGQHILAARGACRTTAFSRMRRVVDAEQLLGSHQRLYMATCVGCLGQPSRITLNAPTRRAGGCGRTARTPAIAARSRHRVGKSFAAVSVGSKRRRAAR